MKAITQYKDNKGRWRWNARNPADRQHRIVADSGQSYRWRISSRRGVKAALKAIDAGRTEIYRGKNGRWYWRCRNRSGLILADSAQGNGYSTRNNAETGLSRAQHVLHEGIRR